RVSRRASGGAVAGPARPPARPGGGGGARVPRPPAVVAGGGRRGGGPPPGEHPSRPARGRPRGAGGRRADLGARAAPPPPPPHRLEGERLVMFHRGVATPERDLAAMEAHVARLEELTGRPLRAKIYWVRGKLLGHGRMALRGLALGSDRSPDDWDTDDHQFAL